MKDTNNQQIYINGKAAIAVLVTLALLVLCLVPMFVGIVMDARDGGAPAPSGGGNGGAVAANKDEGTGNNSTAKTGAKTGISLPSGTNTGTFLCQNDGNTGDISSNTSVKSAAMILIDITDGVAVAAKNADVRIYPASMTKIMTLLVACENAKNPNELLTVTEEMVAEYAKHCDGSSKEGPSVAFTWKAGNQVTVEDALYLIMYESDTYACWLLADYIAGGEEKFVEMMNAKAKGMGLNSTNFTNCTGLYNDNHYTTCREMAAIMAAVMNNSAATSVITKKDYYAVDLYENGEKTEEKGMWSGWYTGRLESNRLQGVAAKYVGGGSDIEIVAGKTGYETVPTNCFVTAAENDTTGRRYVCVQVGRTDKNKASVTAKESTNDTRTVYQVYDKDKEKE